MKATRLVIEKLAKLIVNDKAKVQKQKVNPSSTNEGDQGKKKNKSQYNQ